MDLSPKGKKKALEKIKAIQAEWEDYFQYAKVEMDRDICPMNFTSWKAIKDIYKSLDFCRLAV
jgi:hypothetical protein